MQKILVTYIIFISLYELHMYIYIILYIYSISHIIFPFSEHREYHQRRTQSIIKNVCRIVMRPSI